MKVSSKFDVLFFDIHERKRPMTVRVPTEAEDEKLDALVQVYRAKLSAMTSGEVNALCFASLMTIATRDGADSAAAWARAQADRLDILDCAGSA
jgi:hypothetical protein